MKILVPEKSFDDLMDKYDDLLAENKALRAALSELRDVAEATLSIFANYYGLHADDSQALSSLRAAVESAKEGGDPAPRRFVVEVDVPELYPDGLCSPWCLRDCKLRSTHTPANFNRPGPGCPRYTPPKEKGE